MEKLIITCEIDQLPDDSNILEFQILITEKGWFTRVFKNWRRISYKRAIITALDVKKD